MQHVWEKRQIRAVFWWGNVKESGGPRHKWDGVINRTNVGWINLAEGRDKWRVVYEYTVIKHRQLLNRLSSGYLFKQESAPWN